MEIRRVGVVGLGLLGRGITASLLAHGLEVIADGPLHTADGGQDADDTEDAKGDAQQ